MTILLEKELSSDCDKMSLYPLYSNKSYFLVLLKKSTNSQFFLFLDFFLSNIDVKVAEEREQMP